MVNRDLFGKIPTARAKDSTPVDLQLVTFPKSHTDLAWAVRQGPKGDLAFVPRSMCRPIPNREGWFTLPRWLAKERGWL